MSIKNKDIKVLYGRSAGKCNICKESLTEREVHIGEMAHIIARNINGPRGGEYAYDINSYDNLILLCPTHHTIVDEQPDKFPRGELHRIKEEHESFVQSRLDSSKNKRQDTDSLNVLFEYIPIRRLREYALELPLKVSTKFEATEMFELFQQSNPECYPFWDAKLTELWERFINDIELIHDWVGGSLRGEQLITFHDMINQAKDRGNIPEHIPCYNIYVHDGYDSMRIHKECLSPEQTDLVYSVMPKLVQQFIYSHTELINYIRFNYPDIKW